MGASHKAERLFNDTYVECVKDVRKLIDNRDAKVCELLPFKEGDDRSIRTINIIQKILDVKLEMLEMDHLQGKVDGKVWMYETAVYELMHMVIVRTRENLIYGINEC